MYSTTSPVLMLKHLGKCLEAKKAKATLNSVDTKKQNKKPKHKGGSKGAR